MKFLHWMCLFVVIFPTDGIAQTRLYQEGMVIRMRMTDCTTPRHGILAALSGLPPQVSDGLCPEYTVLGQRIVYVVQGKNSSHLIPLVETIRFRLQKSEFVVRVDDERKESRFFVREMMLRSAWEEHEQDRAAIERFAPAQEGMRPQ